MNLDQVLVHIGRRLATLEKDEEDKDKIELIESPCYYRNCEDVPNIVEHLAVLTEKVNYLLRNRGT